jgi:ectoine hydroxylase-related dioxygenase (phytanoyl-CoA dioxygenase family)
MNFKQFYLENGYVVLPAMMTLEQIEEMRRETDLLIERVKTASRDSSFLWGGKWLSEDERKNLEIDGVHDPQFHSAAFGRLLMNCDGVLDVVEQIIGPNIQLHHTKLIAKQPGVGAPFPMHQDKPYFPHKKDSMLAAYFHFDDGTVENGCLHVVPGSHRLGDLPVQPDGLYLDPGKYRLEDAVPLEAKAGDVVLFSYLTIHGSGVNRSKNQRRNWLVQLRSADDEPAVDCHHSRGQGMMLRGFDPLVRMTSL